MPRYQDKMRLKRYIADHGDCDSLTEHLILKGYHDCIVEEGLERFVSSWGEEAKWIHENLSSTHHEYDCVIRERTELFIVLQHASPGQKAQYSKRIQMADDVFIQSTSENEEPWAEYFPEIGIPDISRHWWLFRIPPCVLDD